MQLCRSSTNYRKILYRFGRRYGYSFLFLRACYRHGDFSFDVFAMHITLYNGIRYTSIFALTCRMGTYMENKKTATPMTLFGT